MNECPLFSQLTKTKHLPPDHIDINRHLPRLDTFSLNHADKQYLQLSTRKLAITKTFYQQLFEVMYTHSDKRLVISGTKSKWYFRNLQLKMKSKNKNKPPKQLHYVLPFILYIHIPFLYQDLI